MQRSSAKVFNLSWKTSQFASFGSSFGLGLFPGWDGCYYYGFVHFDWTCNGRLTLEFVPQKLWCCVTLSLRQQVFLDCSSIRNRRVELFDSESSGRTWMIDSIRKSEVGLWSRDRSLSCPKRRTPKRQEKVDGSGSCWSPCDNKQAI